jgi:hypothetical protein
MEIMLNTGDRYCYFSSWSTPKWSPLIGDQLGHMRGESDWNTGKLVINFLTPGIKGPFIRSDERTKRAKNTHDVDITLSAIDTK